MADLLKKRRVAYTTNKMAFIILSFCFGNHVLERGEEKARAKVLKKTCSFVLANKNEILHTEAESKTPLLKLLNEAI